MSARRQLCLLWLVLLRLQSSSAAPALAVRLRDSPALSIGCCRVRSEFELKELELEKMQMRQLAKTHAAQLQDRDLRVRKLVQLGSRPARHT